MYNSPSPVEDSCVVVTGVEAPPVGVSLLGNVTGVTVPVLKSRS